MGSYTITTTPEEDMALAWKAAQSPTTLPPVAVRPPDPPPSGLSPDEYLDNRVHAQLEQYVLEYNVATSNNPPIDVATAYANGTIEQQTQVDVILGLPPPQGAVRRTP